MLANASNVVGTFVTHPSRTAMPRIATVAYRSRPAANASPNAGARVTKLNTAGLLAPGSGDDPGNQSSRRNGMTRHKYDAGSAQPSGSNVAARSGALKVNLTSSVGIYRKISSR